MKRVKAATCAVALLLPATAGAELPSKRVLTLEAAKTVVAAAEAEAMVKDAVRADVVNRIEVLPTSTYDDQIRWDAYRRVYTEDIASRYVSGGEMEVRYEVLDMRLFPGMEPYGTYPVHIIVKDRQLYLVGLLDTDLDKTQVLHRARQVLNTTGVVDAVTVRQRAR